MGEKFGNLSSKDAPATFWALVPADTKAALTSDKLVSKKFPATYWELIFQEEWYMRLVPKRLMKSLGLNKIAGLSPRTVAVYWICLWAMASHGHAMGSWSSSSQNLFSIATSTQLQPHEAQMSGDCSHIVGIPSKPQPLLLILAVWAQLATGSTQAWGRGACSVAFIAVKIQYMQAICTLKLHAMKFLIVCTLVWIWNHAACAKGRAYTCWEQSILSPKPVPDLVEPEFPVAPALTVHASFQPTVPFPPASQLCSLLTNLHKWECHYDHRTMS